MNTEHLNLLGFKNNVTYEDSEAVEARRLKIIQEREEKDKLRGKEKRQD